MANSIACIVIPKSTHETQIKLKDILSRYLRSSMELLELPNFSADDVANGIAELTAKARFSMIIALAFLGPLTVKNLRNIFCVPTYSLDNAIIEVAGTYINERIAVLVSSDEEEKIFSSHKFIYQVTSQQFTEIRTEGSPEDVVATINQLYDRGYTKFFLGSGKLIADADHINDVILERIGVRKDLVLINPASMLPEFLSHIEKDLTRVSSYEIRKILPCIADSAKIRVVAKLDTNIDNLLSLLYINIKNSRYNDALGALTFTTKYEEMVTIYASGKVCMGKVDDEKRAEELLKELIENLNRAYDYYAAHGAPSEEVLSLRGKLGPMLIYSHLPKLNCKICGEETCYAFAFKLLSGERKLKECKPLYEEGRRHDREVLEQIINPLF